jgi:hypothetical protein
LLPRESEVANVAAMTRQAVSKHLKDLEALGWIEIKPRRDRRGGRLSNCYAFLDGVEAHNPDGVGDAMSENLTPPCQIFDEGRSENLTPPVRFCTPHIDDQTNYQTIDQKTPPPLGDVRFSDMAASENPTTSDALGVFEPDAQLVAWAAAEVPGVNPLDPGILGAFRDHHRGRGTKLANIPAAYRNWLRKERKFASAAQPPNGPRQGEILMPIGGGKSRGRRAGFTATALNAIKRDG